MNKQWRYSESPVGAEDRRYIAECLGRAPRGLAGVPVRDAAGMASVIRVESLVDGEPFPTLFWLVDPALRLALDRLEAAGVIARLQRQILDSENLLVQWKEDHRAHAELRAELLAADSREELARLGYLDKLAARGIGGAVDFSRIKCLHACYAAHRVQSNAVGCALDAGFL